MIDNDSGTYRPPKGNLDALADFLQRNLRGMKVTVCDAFDDGHKEEKDAQKEKAGKRRFKQASLRGSSPEREGSFSSSDEEELRGGKVGLKRKVKNKLWEEVQKESLELDRGREGVNGDAGPSVGVGKSTAT